MNTPKKKLCWNCEGRVNFQDEHCPYCGVYLSPEEAGNEQSKGSLFSAPYRPSHVSENVKSVPAAPYVAEKTTQIEEDEVMEEVSAPASTTATVALEKNSSPNPLQVFVLPLILLLAGSMFFLFGMALILFSNNGKLSLEWSSSIWYVYFILALPMLAWGWKSLLHSAEE